MHDALIIHGHRCRYKDMRRLALKDDLRDRAGVRLPVLVLRVFQICAAGFALGILIKSTGSTAVYTRDLQVEYLTARALRDGVDIFTPIDDLSARYFPVPTDNFRHPNPHPPLLALLALPLTVVSFPIALLCWLIFNVWLLIPTGRRLGLSPPASLALAAWPPLWCVLVLGQLELVILALALVAWREAARGRDWWAGVVLGVAATLKLYPLLFLTPYLARWRVRVVGSAVGVFGIGQAINLLLVGPSGLVRYYTEIVPAVSGVYARLAINVSPYGAFLRLFGGAADVTPILDAPHLVLPLTVACSVVGLVALWRLEPEAAPLSICLVLPTVWYYHPVVALPQICTLLRRERPVFVLLAAAAASTVLPLVNAVRDAVLIAVPLTSGKAPSQTALLTAIQSLGLLVLLALSLRGFRAPEPVPAPAPIP